MWSFVLALFSIVTVVSFVFRQFTFWRRLGFMEIQPSLIVGNLKAVAKGEASFGVAIYDLYKQSNASPFVGIYLFFRPALLINNIDLVKSVLNSDFSHFHDRGVYHNAQHDPLSGGLFQLGGQEWKNLRVKMTPAFSSAKLKNMFPTFHAVAAELERYITEKAHNGCEMEMKDLVSRYIVDIVASTIFGVNGFGCEVNTIRNPNHKFREVGKSFTDPNLINGFRNAGFFLWPSLLKYTGIKFLPRSMRKFCIDIVKATVDSRERDGTVKKDLMQSLIQLRNNNIIEHTDEFKLDANAPKSMSIEQIAAQVFIFYIAGTESTSSTTSFTLHELTQNPELMTQAIKDVDGVLSRHKGEISYDSIGEMKFLDLCVKETLRKYPALPLLNRECTKDYRIPGSDKIIPAGTAVVISLLGLHRDAKYFPEPDRYNPDRFNSADFDSRAYLPFGDGPRNCIAYRMGILATKVALVMLLSKFNFQALGRHNIEFAANTIALDSVHGIKLKVSIR